MGHLRRRKEKKDARRNGNGLRQASLVSKKEKKRK
jgi:hypothetical protein